MTEKKTATKAKAKKKSTTKPKRKYYKTRIDDVIEVKISRSLFSLDGKDHFIIRNKDFSIYADITKPRVVGRSKWLFDKDYEQYWEAGIHHVEKTGANHIQLLKRINRNLGWEDYPEED